MAGRKRTPDKLKIIAGTDRPDRMNADAPIPAPGVAVAPELLSERGAEIFSRLSATLDGMGLASPDDQDNLSMLSQRIEQVELLTVIIEDSGFTYKTDAGLWKARPEVAMRSEAMRHAQSLLSDFGLSPAARAKVSAGKMAETNPFAALG
jgi:P27 family predicted phage terminase small subunit